MQEPTRDDFEAWRNSPIGEWFFNEISEEAEKSAADQGAGSCLNYDSSESTALRYANVCGYINGIAYVVGLDPFPEPEPVEEDDEDREEVDPDSQEHPYSG